MLQSGTWLVSAQLHMGNDDKSSASLYNIHCHHLRFLSTFFILPPDYLANRICKCNFPVE